MKDDAFTSIDRMLKATEISAKVSVKTQYACQVVGVSADGRFVDVVHNIREWERNIKGDMTLINAWGQDVVCTPGQPWILKDIPVEQAYVRGQWSIQARPRIGDKGILSVFYHDTTALKEKGGFQSPPTLRVMAMDSASWRPGLPNHADVNAETATYPDDDNLIINGNGVSLTLTAPNDDESDSPRVAKLVVGGVRATITVPASGAPQIELNATGGDVVVNAQTATLTADTTTINGDVTINGALDVSTTITAGTEVTAGSVNLTTHTHQLTSATAIVAASLGTPAITAVTLPGQG